MKKSEFIEQVAEKAEMSRAAAARAVEAIFDAASGAIAEAARAGSHVSIPGFGRFKTKNRPARKGRNPKTGAEIDIPERTVMSFSASKTLQDTMSGKGGSGKRGSGASAKKTAGAGGTKSAAGGAAKSPAKGAAKSPAKGAAKGATKTAAKSATKSASGGAAKSPAKGAAKSGGAGGAKKSPAKGGAKSAAKSKGGAASSARK